MKGEPVEYHYSTGLKWNGQRKGTTMSEAKPDIEVACPPEFGGHEGAWTPEDLFVASVELCTMSTFLWLAEKRRVSISTYRSSAVGTAKMEKGSLRFTNIEITADVTIPEGENFIRVYKMFDEVKRYCLVNSSVTAEVRILPNVKQE